MLNCIDASSSDEALKRISDTSLTISARYRFCVLRYMSTHLHNPLLLAVFQFVQGAEPGPLRPAQHTCWQTKQQLRSSTRPEIDLRRQQVTPAALILTAGLEKLWKK